MLEVRDITVRFGERAVLDRFSMRLDDGEVVALLGPSGSGKSTLLRVIAGLLVPDGGSVLVDDSDITELPAHQRSIGLVFQDEQLFPHLDVAGNIGFGLRMQSLDRRTIAARVDELLTLIGMPGFNARRVGELSGGEAKRVALARSLAPHPRALLLDEPFTGLDRELHDRLVVQVGDILRATGTSAILVTHDPDEAASIATRTLRLT